MLDKFSIIAFKGANFTVFFYPIGGEFCIDIWLQNFRNILPTKEGGYTVERLRMPINFDEGSSIRVLKKAYKSLLKEPALAMLLPPRLRKILPPI